MELQRYLHDQGYFPRLRETPDGYTGYFGDLTTEALTAWQEDCHLIADGRFGQSARQAVLRQQVCSIWWKMLLQWPLFVTSGSHDAVQS